jgi:hypothetical protein
MINDLWPTTTRTLCARCQLELFADEWFLCSDCRYNSESERVEDYYVLCARVQSGEPARTQRRWKIA